MTPLLSGLTIVAGLLAFALSSWGLSLYFKLKRTHQTLDQLFLILFVSSSSVAMAVLFGMWFIGEDCLLVASNCLTIYN